MRIAVYLSAVATVATAFSPTAFLSNKNKAASSSSSALYISSWGTKGPPSRWANQAQQKKDPTKDIQSYIPEPQPVDARESVEGGTVLISGLVKSPERTDQTVFDLINSEVSAFDFDKIVAFVDDIKFSKKRLLSRSARYTGLLDKLDFVQATSAGALPTPEQLKDVKGWVAYLEGDNLLEKLKQVASIAQSATDVQNVAILLVGANELDTAAAQQAVEFFENGRNDLEYTIVAVGALEDTPEGSVPYHIEEFTKYSIPKDAVFSRAESLRLLTELMQLDCGINRTLAITQAFDEEAPDYKLIKGLRAAGYPRPTEVDYMINVGVDAYIKACEDYKTENPYSGATSDNWWEDERFLANIKERQNEREYKGTVVEEEEEEADARTQEIENIAREWAKREYFRKTMDGAVDMTEEEFVQSVWDQALFEGDLKYRQVHGEVVGDEEAERLNFKKRQELKKAAMLKRAKAELTELLEDEDLGGKDLEEKLASLKAEDDNTSSED